MHFVWEIVNCHFGFIFGRAQNACEVSRLRSLLWAHCELRNFPGISRPCQRSQSLKHESLHRKFETLAAHAPRWNNGRLLLMFTTLVFLAVCFLAYSNGANDNFKGVASLFKSRTCSYRTAIS